MSELPAWLPSSASFLSFPAVLALLAGLALCCLAGTVAKPQAGARDGAEPSRAGRLGAAGLCLAREAIFQPGPEPTCPDPPGRPPELPLPPLPGGLDLPEPLQPLQHQDPVVDALQQTAQQLHGTIQHLMRYLNTLSSETPEGNNMACEVTYSQASLPPSREDFHSPIMSGRASSCAETSLYPPSDNSSWTIDTCSSPVSLFPSREDSPTSDMTDTDCFSARESLAPSRHPSQTSITASNTGFSPLVSLPSVVDGADTAHASSVPPGLKHPWAGPAEQPGPATHSASKEEAASCFEAARLQQHQEDLAVQLGAPTPPPELPDVHCSPMEMSGQETWEGIVPEHRLEQERATHVDEAPEDVPASAPPTPQPAEEKRDVVLVSIPPDLPFLDEAVKMNLEHYVTRLKILKRHGFMMMLDMDESFATKVLS